ncbi:MAG TPA: biosynthetic peptidoglycan transglycosylase [Thermoanaerobaculaceae bacterium]|nr:biosynthetic peptidoglycan transglycosylase [Thermoanaerobaculaceae bacterium]HRS16736.1 biosynthetic peptidoglycan transglycosylase [Thermoanaerobaculaceae bacterium]
MRVRRRPGCGAVLAAVLAGGAAVAVWWARPGVDLEKWRRGPLPLEWASWRRQVQVWEREGLQRRPEHAYRPLREISEHLAVAVLVSEDISYFGHGAVDPRAVWEVVKEWRSDGRLRGASTVSQQVARILFLSPERSIVRKLEEARLAYWLERRLGKRRVLEIYLNTVEFGPGLFGAEAAARHYFGSSATALSPEQAAALAAAIPAPGRDNPDTATAKWEFRRDTVQRRMQRAGWLRNRLAGMAARPEP